MACPGVDTMAQMACRMLPAADASSVEGHCADCRDCRALLAALAASALTRPARGPAVPTAEAPTSVARGSGGDAAPRLLTRGTRLDRFTIRECLGAGGMGIVYAAHDPQLDREVALKVVRPELAVDGARDLLVAEAQAMARVHHPNVITVHEVGTAGDDIFIAMALCRGGTLRGWLRGERTLREILDVLLDAGRGLAAAHRAGLVHRDFKPDNVLLDDSGRACVSDFGLARPSGTDDGELAGTPAYMAPEQRAGAAPDARADQYAFCLVVREALGQRAVPRGLSRAVDRGLAPDPDDRHPSMDALVTLLARDWRARRRMIAAGGVAALVAGSAAAVLAIQVTAPAPERACRAMPASQQLWTDAARSNLRQRFVATRAPFAAATADRVVAALDGWARRWGNIDSAGCRATHDGSRTAVMRDRQTVCLQRQLAEVRGLIELFDDADDAMVERAVTAVERIDTVDRCDDVAVLAAAVPPPPAELRTSVDRLRDHIAQVRARRAAGRTREALTLALPLGLAARAVGYRAIEAEVFTLLGALHHDLDQDELAITDLRAAIAAADAAADDRQRAVAMTELGHAFHALHRDPERGRLLADLAPLVERLRGDTEIAANAATLDGNARLSDGDYPGALERFRTALAARETLGEGRRTAVAAAHQAIGNVLNRMGRSDEALAEHQLALTVFEEALGPDHPRVAAVCHDIAQTLNGLGRLDEARVMLERALVTRIAVLGEQHRDVARVRADLALVLLDLEHPDDARREIDLAVAALTASLGPDHPDVAVTIVYRGDIEVLTGDPAAGLADYLRGIEITERAHGPDHPRLAELYARKGDALRHLKRFPEAIATAEHVNALRLRMYGPDDPMFAYGLHALGLTHLDAGDARKALPLLERALSIRLAAGDALDPLEVANSRLTIAHALRALHRDPARASELARAARDVFATAGAAGNEKLADAEAFLKN